jgi:hypothetical protein
LLLAYTIGPLAFARAAALARTVLLVLLSVALLLAITAKNWELVPAWPAGYTWIAVLGAGVVVLVFALRRYATRWIAAATALGVVIAAVSFWYAQHHYLEHRYVRAALTLDTVNERFKDVRDSSVAIYGSVEDYPMFGDDLSNWVAEPVVNGPVTDPCQVFRAVREGKYRYVILTQVGLVLPETPPRAWFDDTRDVDLVYQDARTQVYRVLHPLQGTGCAT